MGHESPQDTADLRFVVAVRDVNHLESVLRQLKRTPSVIQAERQTNKGTAPV
jgi:GTP pyrophosphokinase